jgi:uncharacterized protein YbjT (DUF2867 family)
MVGSNVLKACLESDEIGRLISFLRRPSGMEHPKLKEIVIDDFLDYSANEDLFKNVDIAFFCLAVYAGKVSKAEYRKITVDYTRAFASTLKEQSPEASFCLFGAAGADSSEKSRMQFARDKGAAENVVRELGFPSTYIFRPGYIYPVEKRKEPSIMYGLSRRMYPLLKAIYPNGVITSEQLGRAMFKTGLNGGDQIIYENRDILCIEAS